MYDYEEACPVSKAASVLCERWTLQILREMLMGASRFSELQTYLPRLSPTLLNKRLASLQDEGLIIRRKIPEKRGHEYQLTPMGQAVLPILQAMGQWGMQYAFDSMNEEEINASVIVRDFATALKLDQLPTGDITIQFNIETKGELAKKFIMVRKGEAQICDENLGTDVNMYLTADLGTLAGIWYGELSVIDACKAEKLKAVGDTFLKNNLSRWLGVSQFAPFNRKNRPAC